MKPTYDRVLSLLDYDQATGFFTWKPRSYGNKKPRRAKQAGHVRPDGYRMIEIDGHSVYEHILAWFWMTGRWPELQVDHINFDRACNAWSNLRLLTPSENCLARERRHSQPGITHLPNGKWRARLKIGDKRIHIGVFESKDQALSAVRERERSSRGVIAWRWPGEMVMR